MVGPTAVARLPVSLLGVHTPSYRGRSCPSPPTRAAGPDRIPTPRTLYDLLSVKPYALPEAVKAAYRAKQKLLHPDVCGRQATEVAVLLNLAAATLTNDALRRQYDRSLGRFGGWASSQGAEALFVNEAQCIGCMQCVSVCPNTFTLEPEHGRARVVSQDGDRPDAQEEAADLCPVECIHRVPAQQLDRLEHALTLCEREDAATLADRRSGSLGAGPARNDPFTVAASLPADWAPSQPAALPAPAAAAAAAADHSQELAAAIAQAWLGLPAELRQQGWPKG